MKPEIHRICHSLQCQLYNVEVRADEDILPEHCSECGLVSRLRVTFHGIETTSVDHFYAVASGMAREAALLRRLGEAGAATASDKRRLDDLNATLLGLECSHCGQPLLDHEV